MYQNQLIHEKSPYLLQHAHNPVNWYPWKQEAFLRAKEEDKPIFLSIGYSTCHWCHVMEKESFENEEIAELLNEYFICIKVDREERPDIDAVYMEACQVMLGQGGWPLTVLMTPEGKPFFIATYLPPKKRWGGFQFGLKELVLNMAKEWKENRERLLKAGTEIEDHLKKQSEIIKEGEFSEEIFSIAEQQFERSFDTEYGGFGYAPKFPTPHHLLFLLRYAKNKAEQKALEMAEKTLQQMYLGGMFDHIGGGFSRYSTDNQWLVPHFEKMLYDNALLSYTYLQAYQMTGKEMYQYVAEKTLQYVKMELTSKEGGFYCGQDADSEGEEGKFYIFTKKELEKLLGKKEGEYFCHWFQITERGNFEGKNIPNLLHHKEKDLKKEERERIDALSERVLSYRKGRMSLHKDDKILTSWNGLMIASFAKASVVLGKEEYLEIAEKAETFLEKNLIKEGKIMVRFRDKETAIEGMLEDYAFYCFALLELYQATLKLYYLEKVIYHAEKMIEEFFDPEHGGFFLYGKNSEKLLIRPKENYDGATPSGNSMALYLLEHLFRITGEIKWQQRLEKQMEYLAGIIKDYPMGYSFALWSLLPIYQEKQEIMVTGEISKEDKRELCKWIQEKDGIVLVKTEENEKQLSEIAPFTKEYKVTEEPLFYFCSGQKCSPPEKKLRKILEKI